MSHNKKLYFHYIYQPSWTDYEALAGLLGEGGLEELWVNLLGLELHHAGPDHVPLDLQQPLEVLQPLHLVIQVS